MTGLGAGTPLADERTGMRSGVPSPSSGRRPAGSAPGLAVPRDNDDGVYGDNWPFITPGATRPRPLGVTGVLMVLVVAVALLPAVSAVARWLAAAVA